MFAPLAHISLTELTDASRHAEYNAQQSLERDPRLLHEAGIAWTERWVRSPDCVAADSAAAKPASCNAAHYARLTWFRAPAEASAQRFADLAERDFQQGRRADLDWSRSLLDAYFVPLKGYVAPRVLVSSEALPFRPGLGAYLAVSRFTGHGAEAEDRFRWYDQVRIPALLECAGTAGAWSFASWDLFRPSRDHGVPALRALVVYLDGDPLRFIEDLAARGTSRDASDIEEALFASPLRSIVPWRWSWFDSALPNARKG
jgi:hypothetical protein